MPARKPTKSEPSATPKRQGGRPSPLHGLFESREKEPSAFDIMGVRPIRDFSTGRLQWLVPPEKVELFRMHHHVANNRVVYVGRIDRAAAAQPDEAVEAVDQPQDDAVDQEDEAAAKS